MLHEINVHNVMTDKALSSYFHNAGDNKNIILSLIGSLESTVDVVQADVIRKTLEIVLRYTADDV